MNVGAGDAGMSDVTEDGDIEIVERAFAIADGERIEEALRGMFVSAVTGIDDGNFEMTRDEIGGTGGGMTHDEAVRLHGVEIVGGVQERFAFFEAGGFGLEIHGVGAEAGCGSGEAEAGARGIFEEGECNGFAAKGGELFQGMALDFLEGFGLIEEKSDFVRGERL